MLRFAIYARYSTDRQNPSSIEDQVSLCKGFAERKSWQFVEVYADAEISGGSTEGRIAFGRMMADAEDRRFDLVLAEDMDRLSRNLGDTERLRERMEYYGVAIHTIADGEITQINATLKGLTSAIFLKGHAQRMRGRMAEIARKGLSAGGLTYGYMPGTTKGSRIIVEPEAEIVRRIFKEYLEDKSPRDIAARLNADGIRPPRGRDWLASTINGNLKRQSGILGNALYDGRLVYNRVSMRKVPGTNKRVSRPNPESEWIVQQVPALRIVDIETFANAQALKAGRGKMSPGESKRRKHLLAGLLKCGCCGSSMVLANGQRASWRRIYCGRRKEGGRCENGKTYALAPIEHRIIEALKAQLVDPRAIAHYVETYQAERKRLAANNRSRRDIAQRRLAQVRREIDRLVDAMAKGTLSDTEVTARIVPLRKQRDELEAVLASMPAEEKTVSLHETALRRYRVAVQSLAETLDAPLLAEPEAARALHELVSAAIIHPEKHEPRIEVIGRLAQLTGGELFPHGWLRKAVAGTRYRQSQTPEFRFAA